MRRLPLALLLLATVLLAPRLRLAASAPVERVQLDRFWTSRQSPVELALPEEDDGFQFAVFGDRTGGPDDGVIILAQAVEDVNLVEPDLVMTVGDLINGYNQTPQWMVQMREFKGIMNRLRTPWFPVAGNHDVYWRGPDGQRPEGEHEGNYEEHFGPLWYAFEHKRSTFVVLYTDEGDPSGGAKRYNHGASQRLSPEQTAWLEGTLERARDSEHVFVFLHHPRWIQGGYGDDWERVHQMLAAAGNVRAVFAGHIHRMRYDGPRDGIEYFVLATIGASQSGAVPAAGFLHHYELVTVRDDHIAVMSVPVGVATDPRRITGEVSDETRALHGGLRPTWSSALPLGEGAPRSGALPLSIHNPIDHAIEVELAVSLPDPRWSLQLETGSAAIPAGGAWELELRWEHGEATLDAAFAAPALVVHPTYLADGWRVPLEPRTWALPLELGELPAPPQPADESALRLDGNAHARVEAHELELPDGPFTLEGWVRAEHFADRQGFLAKTESSEYGIFLNGGRPGLSVHLAGAYAEVQSDRLLEAERWHHVAGVFDGSELRLYVDGQLAGREAGAGARTINALPLIIGGDVGAGGSANSTLEGEIDGVRLSSVARYSGQDFLPARRHLADEHTYLLLHMDAAQGPWLHDSSPKAAHATTRGAASISDVDQATRW